MSRTLLLGVLVTSTSIALAQQETPDPNLPGNATTSSAQAETTLDDQPFSKLTTLTLEERLGAL